MKEINLTQGKIALVDDEDYEWLMQWRWSAVKNGERWYAVRGTEIKGVQKRIYMHREVFGGNGNFSVDHIDRNGLNNTRRNLRECTREQNAYNSRINKNNTSGYKGVSLCKPGKKGSIRYSAKIMFNRKPIHIGYFKNPIDAAKAYDEAAKELFGEFANLNFP